MKIAFYYFSTHSGGQQHQILNLSKYFNEFGYKVIWIYEEKGETLNEFKKFGQAIQVPILSYLSVKFYFIRALYIIINMFKKYFFLKEFFKKETVDVVVSNDSLMSLIIGLSGRRQEFKQFRLIGADLEGYEKIFKYYKLLKIDQFISLYFGWPLVYESLKKKGVSEKKFINFQHNAVDTEKFFPLGNDINMQTKKTLDIKKEEFTIGWVGRLDEFYGSKHLLSIGKKLLKKGIINFKIIYVGGGFIENGIENLNYVNFLKKRAEKYGLKNNVLFLGWISPHLVNDYYNIMDFIPMLEKDPSGGSILREAMACGRVAISVDGPSQTQRVFMKPNNSILVSHVDFVEKATNEIISIFSDKNKRIKLGKNARKFCVKNLSFKKQAQDIIYYFNSFINGKN